VHSDRFVRFLPLAGVLAGLLLVGGLTLSWSIPNSETSFEETFSWWQDNRGQHQISGLILAPLVALMLIFFGAGYGEVSAAAPVTPVTARLLSVAQFSAPQGSRSSESSKPLRRTQLTRAIRRRCSP
jgi:uncharacterized iron-regulated membrane protein